jgi:hypothetical protein
VYIKLRTNKNMETDFDKLKRLEMEHKITIGTDRGRANIFWSRQTKLGKFFNFLTLIIAVFSIYIFVIFGFWEGALVVLVLGLHVIAIQNIACDYVREHTLQDKIFFDQFYYTRFVTIKVNSTKRIISRPTIWENEISMLD